MSRESKYQFNEALPGFGKRLDFAIRSNMRLTDFSDLTGFGRMPLYRWRYGKRLPSTRSIATICETLDISADWLLFGKGEMYAKIKG